MSHAEKLRMGHASLLPRSQAKNEMTAAEDSGRACKIDISFKFWPFCTSVIGRMTQGELSAWECVDTNIVEVIIILILVLTISHGPIPNFV